jgi:pseudouridine-5'-phosphate glycosidase
MQKYIEIKDEVQKAMDNHQAVVALESTIISHGMPYPENVKTAQEVEQIVRDNGAVPATIAIIDGKIKIGLNAEELELIAHSDNVAKVSRRDLPEVISLKTLGATTVASTMICAAMAGIRFFVTGGIGGVHRGVEETMDISADLEELGKTNVAVICAGAKSILDLDRTMEYLETKGVPVIGYGTNELPAFFTRESGIQLNSSASSTADIADIIKTKYELNLEGGVLVANPILKEDALDKEYIDRVINEAIDEAEAKGIHGKDTTPYLLGKIVEATEGKSLETNIKLVKNNAVIGSKIAVDYYK